MFTQIQNFQNREVFPTFLEVFSRVLISCVSCRAWLLCWRNFENAQKIGITWLFSKIQSHCRHLEPESENARHVKQLCEGLATFEIKLWLISNDIMDNMGAIWRPDVTWSFFISARTPAIDFSMSACSSKRLTSLSFLFEVHITLTYNLTSDDKMLFEEEPRMYCIWSRLLNCHTTIVHPISHPIVTPHFCDYR